MSEDYRVRIGALIRDARRHKGLTQAELAKLLATSQSAVARIEQGLSLIHISEPTRPY